MWHMDKSSKLGIASTRRSSGGAGPWLSLAFGLRAMAILLLAVWMAVVLQAAARPTLAVALGIGATASLCIQRRAPLVTLASAYSGLLLVDRLAAFPGPDDPFIVLIIWASFGVGRFARARRQPWAAAGALFFLSLNLVSGEHLALPAEVVFPVVFTAVPWILGLAMQLAKQREQRAHRFAHEVVESQELLLQQATQEERLRLARELHDVAAHSMSAVSLQAQVMASPARVRCFGSTRRHPNHRDRCPASDVGATTSRRGVASLRRPGCLGPATTDRAALSTR